MNLEEFRSKFFAETESLFNRYAEDKVYENENFLNLLALNNCDKLYGSFKFYYKPNTFQDICNIFSMLEHDIEDDGMVSIFTYTVEKHFKDDCEKLSGKTSIQTDYKVVGGEFGYSLTEQNLIQAVEKESAHSLYKEQKLISWKLTRFDWENLKFLASFVPEYLEMIKISNEEMTTRPVFGKLPGWWKMSKEIEEKIVNHFSEKPYMTSEQWKSGQRNFS